jgi:hypothetical protein
MSLSQDTTFLRAGEIQIREGKKGKEFFAFNHEHKKPLHIGTLSGATYEKTAPMLRKPEPSFCLPSSELSAVERAGGLFIRFIARGSVGTYATSLEDFKRHGEKYFNASYGSQVRLALKFFQYSPKVAKRNPIVDNPVIAINEPIGPKQPSLFGGMK